MAWNLYSKPLFSKIRERLAIAFSLCYNELKESLNQVFALREGGEEFENQNSGLPRAYEIYKLREHC